MPDQHQHTGTGQSHNSYTLSLHSSPTDNHSFAISHISRAFGTSAGAGPCLSDRPSAYDREGPFDNSHSPRFQSDHCGAGQDHQQRPCSRGLPEDASSRPACSCLASDSYETIEHSSASVTPTETTSTTSLTSPSAATFLRLPATETRSKPIPIAVPRTKPKHTGLTPLSGRPPASCAPSGSLSYHCVRSRTPSPSSNFHTHYSTPISVLSPDRHPYRMTSRPSQSSPLSPTVPAQPMMIPPRRDQPASELHPPSRPIPRPRPAAQHLNLTGLPKYHPANFPTSGDNSPLSPRSIQALNASKRVARPGSDAQHALHKYQREVVTRASGLSELAKPTSPRLIPEGSPTGSMTPLALEAQSDYLLSASKLPANAVGARKVVDKLLQKENDERDHPDARRSQSHSPAVTPPV